MGDIRTILGMSQNLFATWIGVERSLLAKFEGHNRSMKRQVDAYKKSTDLEMLWQAFSENYTHEIQTIPALSPAEVNKRQKRVDNLLLDVRNISADLKTAQKPGINFPMVRSFLKSIQDTETSPSAQYAIQQHLTAIEKKESTKIRAMQNMEIALRKAQAEIDYLKTQPDWQLFFEPEASPDSENLTA
jgi:hypothetical protein